ncbi:MAG: fructose-bisphosphate aldolase, partial [Firmicutes bacterium]|nr:fructose-bisphosphate aldolase [Bacillota bacterium]
MTDQTRPRLIVAMDHALEMGPVVGLEDPGRVITQAIAAGADGILTSPGIAKRYRGLLSGTRVYLRLDVQASTREMPGEMRLLYSAEYAAAVGATGVACMGYIGSEWELDTL